MVKNKMYEQLEKLTARYQELEYLLGSHEQIVDRQQYNKLAKELSDIKDVVSIFRGYKNLLKEISDLEGVLSGKHEQDFLELAQEELKNLQAKKTDTESELKKILAGEDKDAGRNCIVEIRQGTGGDEAGLFAAVLYRMYSKYADYKGWVIEPMYSSINEAGGIKEIVFSVKGKDSFRCLKFESGVHRVQRVPTTEAQGRIHTSTATVAVLVEPEEIDLVIEPKDLRIDTYRSSGPGGQHMQKTDSAVRITHLPTGTVVACQDERSQIKNRAKAMRVLRARILEVKVEEEAKRLSSARKTQIGTGDRSEKIRTYNFPDRRVTDHRINFTAHQLEAVLEGQMDELFEALLKAESEKKNE
ncbi:MAG: peptide chain release factor 1 [Candidatus Omnitrophica bacterium]|nr:peptide chain release factor 1 [Candidatus Omnitrophota bacterium]MBU4302998.1 peptide chain release factor 1 [Candidatus Omnitrophota bacterium]MBU4418289.1 peptide chain release factor 1 [Candidatus Omnitrophota bacterium]MBU4467434.1 peptide chain release factor 1 [Candidatus Omnitrophota bacterium]MCG2708529.1 peptide chain release factor 1 [Candidatus Omnitrophota bacterium]